MILNQIKLYAYLGVAAIAIGGFFYVKYVFNERDKLKVELKEAELTRDTAIASAFLYQENNERQVKLISEYQVKLDEKQKANSALERDVDAGIRKLRIKGSSCPASTASTDTSTTQAASISDPAVRSDIFDLRGGIILLEENYALCLKILEEDRKKPSRGGQVSN